MKPENGFNLKFRSDFKEASIANTQEEPIFVGSNTDQVGCSDPGLPGHGEISGIPCPNKSIMGNRNELVWRVRVGDDGSNF